MSTVLQVEVLEGARLLARRTMGRYDNVRVGPSEDAEILTDRVPRMIPMIRSSPGGKGWELVFPEGLDGHVTAGGRSRTLRECAADPCARKDGDLAVFPLPEGAAGGIELGALFVRFREVLEEQALPVWEPQPTDETLPTALGIAVVANLLVLLALLVAPRVGPPSTTLIATGPGSPTPALGWPWGPRPARTPVSAATEGGTAPPHARPAGTSAPDTTPYAAETGSLPEETETPPAGAITTVDPARAPEAIPASASAATSPSGATPDAIAATTGAAPSATPTVIVQTTGVLAPSPMPVAAATGAAPAATPLPVAARTGGPATTPAPIAAVTRPRPTLHTAGGNDSAQATRTPDPGADGSATEPPAEAPLPTPRRTEPAVLGGDPDPAGSDAGPDADWYASDEAPDPDLARGVEPPHAPSDSPPRSAPSTGFLDDAAPIDERPLDRRLAETTAAVRAPIVVDLSTGGAPDSGPGTPGRDVAKRMKDGGQASIGDVVVGPAGTGSVKIASAGKVETPVDERVRAQPPRLTGSIDPDAVLRVVQEAAGAFRHCYEQVLRRSPRLAGRVVMRWTIVEDGAVEEVSVGASTLRNDEIEGCMGTRVQRLRFPRPDGGPVKVEFPFLFQAAASEST